MFPIGRQPLPCYHELRFYHDQRSHRPIRPSSLCPLGCLRGTNPTAGSLFPFPVDCPDRVGNTPQQIIWTGESLSRRKGTDQLIRETDVSIEQCTQELITRHAA